MFNDWRDKDFNPSKPILAPPHFRCNRCNGRESTSYFMSTDDYLVFDDGIVCDEETLNRGGQAKKNFYKWEVPCPACARGDLLAIPMSDLIHHNKTGIKEVLDPTDPYAIDYTEIAVC